MNNIITVSLLLIGLVFQGCYAQKAPAASASGSGSGSKKSKTVGLKRKRSESAAAQALARHDDPIAQEAEKERLERLEKNRQEAQKKIANKSLGIVGLLRRIHYHSPTESVELLNQLIQNKKIDLNTELGYQQVCENFNVVRKEQENPERPTSEICKKNFQAIEHELRRHMLSLVVFPPTPTLDATPLIGLIQDYCADNNNSDAPAQLAPEGFSQVGTPPDWC